MSRVRDSQRSKLYRAERTLEAAHAPMILRTKDEAYRFIDKILSSAWARRQWPQLERKRYNLGVLRWKRPDIVMRRMAATAGQHSGNEIKLNPDYATPLVIVHELAHWIEKWAARDYSKPSTPGHGREFAAIYLLLVRHVFGFEAHKQLRQAYVANGVRYRAKRKISAEAMERLRERGRQLQQQRQEVA